MRVGGWEVDGYMYGRDNNVSIYVYTAVSAHVISCLVHVSYICGMHLFLILSEGKKPVERVYVTPSLMFGLPPQQTIPPPQRRVCTVACCFACMYSSVAFLLSELFGLFIFSSM